MIRTSNRPASAAVSESALPRLVEAAVKNRADLAAVARRVERTDIQLRAQILSYSRARGLFAGVTINGSTVRQDVDANARFYGERLTTTQIVFDGRAGSPDPVGLWRAALLRYAQ